LIVVHPASSGSALPFGSTLGGGLRILESLGATPEGSLYQAEYPNGQRVALLVLQPTADGGHRSKWDRFHLATQIQHPNVAAVYATGQTEDGSLYVILEQLEGEPLLSSLAGRAFALGEAVDIALQTAAGLHAAHAAGFIHGNLSPRTVLMIRPPYGKPQVKLIGFHLDPVNRRVTTPSDEASVGYASPERLAGSPLDERSDVFSVGALLHHLLTGTPPAHGPAARGIPKIARPVLARALAPDPDQRYQTMYELHEALEQLLPAAAGPRRPGRRFLFRATAAGLALAAGGTLLLWSSNRRDSGEDPRIAQASPAQVRPPPPSGSSAAARPPARRESGGSAKERETRKTSPLGASASRPAPATRPPANSGELGDTDANPSMETTRAAGPPPRVEEPDTVAAEPPRERRADERPEAQDVRGYVGDPPSPSPRRPPAGRTTPPATRQPTPAGPTRPSPDSRAREELEQNQGLALAIGDVLRIGLAEDVTEMRRGWLAISLAPGGLSVPSATYNLQRLYLAYSAATRELDEVVLELRDEGEVYGRFTREGLVPAPAD
jgi:serine/threonine protein kinase